MSSIKNFNMGSDMKRAASHESAESHIDDYKAARILDDHHLSQMDDEQRELPKGWVRCFDTKSKHHFYVDTATRKAIWHHPYDDPDYLATLPPDHPAQPNSEAAKAARAHAEEEGKIWEEHSKELSADGKSGRRTATEPPAYLDQESHAPAEAQGQEKGEQKEKGWIDRIFGTKEERDAHRAEKFKIAQEEQARVQKSQEEYLKRRQELELQNISASTKAAGAYAADPYAYDPPPGPYVPGMAFGGVGYGTSFHVLIHVFSRGVSRAEPERQKPRRRRVTGRVSRRMGSTIWIRTLRTWIRRIWTIWIRRVLSPPRGPLGPCGRPDRAPGYDDGRPRVAGGAADVWRLWAILAN